MAHPLKYFSKHVRLCLLIAAILLGTIGRNPILYVLYSWSYERAFHLVLKEAVADEKNLDLREFNQGAWDEMIWFGPHENPCDYGMEFKEWWHPCSSTKIDNSFKLYFVKNGSVVAGFKVLRSDLEIVESAGIPKRISRQEALFKFDHFEQYPTLQQYKE